jgi:hypothetical protein
MGLCYFCAERERIGYWSYWCEECAMLRRMLLINTPQKCIDILKRTLTRDDKQIDFKINQEIKKIVNNEIEKMPSINEEKISAVSTRSKKV